jgi:copper oxidase (laccase) domain-containing protein
MTNPVWTYRSENYSVGLFGYEAMDDTSLALELGGHPIRTCLVKAAGNSTMPGFRTIARFACGSGNWNTPTHFADGVRLPHSGVSAIIRPADCPVVLLYEARTHRGMLLHCGRPAMTPIIQADGTYTTFLAQAAQKLVCTTDTPHLSAVITGAICRDCFTHDCINDNSEVGQFRTAFPHLHCVDEETGGLDLVQVIVDQLLTVGVGITNIVHDGICTYGEPRLASYKRDRTTLRNAVVAVLH